MGTTSEPVESNLLLDTKRSQTRAKVQRFRSRAALREFTSTELRVADNLAQGLPDRQALVKAGSNYWSDGTLEKGKQALQAILDAHQVTLDYTVRKVKELAEATKPMLTATGSIDVAAWDARSRGLGYVIGLQEAAGQIPKAQVDEHHGTAIQFNLHLQNLSDVSQAGAEKAKRHKRKAAKAITVDLNTEQTCSDNR